MIQLKDQKLGENVRKSFSRTRFNLELPDLVEIQTRSYAWFLREGQLGFDVFEDTLRENKTLFADAAQYGVPVVISKRNSGINVIDGINRIVDELLDKLGYE